MPRTYIKRICYILVISCILGTYHTELLASSYSSSNYTLIMPRIVTSGGFAGSPNYSIIGAHVGGVFGGATESQNYSVDASTTKKRFSPNTPALNPVTTPTNVSTQDLTGTKDPNTSIYINGYLTVPLDSKTTWTYIISLTEGGNDLVITARNIHGLESDPVYATITLDTIPPVIVIDSPLDGAIVYQSPVTVQGTVDDAPFTEDTDVSAGENTITITRTDEAGNEASEEIDVYLAIEPIALPQLPAQ